MANGRVVARVAGDTPSGAFTCVVRRTSFADRTRYIVELVNDSAAAADVTIMRYDMIVQAMSVPPRAHIDCRYIVARGTVPIVVTATCEGVTLSARERSDTDQSSIPPEDFRRLIIVSACSAIVAALCVAVVFAAVSIALFRRSLGSAERRTPDVIAAIEKLLHVASDAVQPEASAQPEPIPIIEPLPIVEPLLIDAPLDSVEIAESAETPEPSEPDATTPLVDNVDAVHTSTSGTDALAVDDPEPAVSEVEVLDPEPVRATPMLRTNETWEMRQPRRDMSLFPLLTAFVIAGALVIGFILAHPHVGDLGAPNMVLEGSAIDVPYSSSGIGSLRYAVVSSQGESIASGPLTERSGLLHVLIPTVKHNEAYRVRLVMTGPLGDASNEATVGASAIPATRVVLRTASAPMIRSFAIARSVVNNVPTIVAYYDVIADSGTLRLVDARGIQYQIAPISPSGETTLSLPPGVDPATVALELSALRNGTTVVSRIALPTGGAGTNVAVASPAPEPGTAGSDAAPIAVPDRAIGSEPIHVRITHHYPQLHVALLDQNARKIVGIDVPPNAATVTLIHPPVSATTRMTVEATYRDNTEADTIVRPIVLIPSGG